MAGGHVGQGACLTGVCMWQEGLCGRGCAWQEGCVWWGHA